MKKLLLVLIGLPLALSAMEPRKYTLKNEYALTSRSLNVYKNLAGQRVWDNSFSCLIDELFSDAAQLTKQDIQYVNRQLHTHNKNKLAHILRQDTGNTLLHQIVLCNGSPDTVKYLLNNGFDQNQINQNYQTPLQIAQEQNNAAMIAALTESPIDMTAQSPEPDTSTEPGDISDKNAGWLAFATVENGVLAVLVTLAGNYFWQRYTADDAKNV